MLVSRMLMPSALPASARPSAARKLISGSVDLSAVCSGSAGPPRLRRRQPIASVALRAISGFG
jgi:hypothetical protein